MNKIDYTRLNDMRLKNYLKAETKRWRVWCADTKSSSHEWVTYLKEIKTEIDRRKNETK